MKRLDAKWFESQDSFKEWYCNEYKGSEEVLEKAKSIIESL